MAVRCTDYGYFIFPGHISPNSLMAAEPWKDPGPVFRWQEGLHLYRADKWTQGEKAEGASITIKSNGIGPLTMRKGGR